MIILAFIAFFVIIAIACIMSDVNEKKKFYQDRNHIYYQDTKKK